jgi:hypothetical protein
MTKLDLTLQKVLNRIMPQRQSTKRVDDMANGIARAALDRRLTQMLERQAELPAPLPQQFAPLSNPNQKLSNS